MSKKSKINVANAISSINYLKGLIEDKEMGIEPSNDEIFSAGYELEDIKSCSEELLKELKGEK